MCVFLHRNSVGGGKLQKKKRKETYKWESQTSSHMLGSLLAIKENLLFL